MDMLLPDQPCAAEAPLRVLRPGRNCWRIAAARRAAVLTNGGYFRVLAAALAAAGRSVLVVGWDLDARLVLDPKADGPAGRPLHEFLRALLQVRTSLEIRFLIWDRPLVYGGNRRAARWMRALRRDCPGFDFRFVRAPLGSSHHQKLVVIDDHLAFVGGIDLAGDRWDRRDHPVFHPRRRTPDGGHYGPIHDLQMLVEGEVASVLAEHARDHWRRAAGEALTPVTEASARWPAMLPHDFHDLPIAVARTDPFHQAGPVREVEALTLDSLRCARQALYVEAQYLTADAVGAVLEARLRESDGPEIVVIVTRTSHGLVEQLAMGNNRDRLIRRLRAADHAGRLRIFYPCVRGDGGEVEMNIHAKLIIADDRFLRVGSSNLNNRSSGCDTECDLAIEGIDAASRAQILGIRTRLLAELLHHEPPAVSEALATHGLIGAIDRLNHPRHLCPTAALREAGPTTPMPGTAILDPDAPLSLRGLWQVVTQRRRRPGGRSTAAAAR